jgi:ABC-2 type transport system ATP-binding protein
MNGAPAPVIAVEGLTKTFKSRFGRPGVTAVRDLSLQVQPGSVVAFVGPNGAGKTTTIYALLGLVHPDRGSIRLLGAPAGSIEARRRTGFQAEIFYTYGFKTAERVLAFYGTLSGLAGQQLRTAVAQQLGRLGLAKAGDRKVRGFSKGMTQRLGLAQALLHKPELLILDEPTTGLDPEGRRLVAEIILEEKARGATVFLSSHILSDVERTCDHVVILSQGSVVFSEDMAKLRSDADEWDIEVLALPAAAQELAAAVRSRTGAAGSIVLQCTSSEKDVLLLRLLQAGASIGNVRRAHTLEDIYMRYAGGSSSG